MCLVLREGLPSGLLWAAWIAGAWPLMGSLDWWSLASLGQPGLVESGLFGAAWIGGVWPLMGQPGLVESGLFGTTWIGGAWPLMGSLDWWSLASLGQPGLVESGLFGAAWIGGVWPLWYSLDWWSLASLGQPGLLDASWYHHREAQNHSPEHSLSPFLAGGMIFPPPSGMLDPCQFSSNN